MGGCINIYTSRRTKHIRCKHWKVNAKNRDLSELVHDKKYDIFFAKEVAPQSRNDNNIDGTFMFNQDGTTIMTSDAVDINENDAVEYLGSVWLVVNTQVVTKKRETEFCYTTDTITYIQLRK